MVVGQIVQLPEFVYGKNRQGKNAVALSYGFEANNSHYYEEVSKIINTSEKLKKSGDAAVIIRMLFDDGKYNNIYTFDRSWKLSGKRISEKFNLYKNGAIVSENEKSDFESYILQLLPPNLFRFYFFDGERISDFVFNSNKNSDFKEAFLKLCNLDTMEIIRENFRRISKSKAKGGESISHEYDRCVEEDNRLATRVSYAEEEYTAPYP